MIYKIVTVSVSTRVLVDENATDEQIAEIALGNLVRNLSTDGALDHLDSIIIDPIQTA